MFSHNGYSRQLTDSSSRWYKLPRKEDSKKRAKMQQRMRGTPLRTWNRTYHPRIAFVTEHGALFRRKTFPRDYDIPFIILFCCFLGRMVFLLNLKDGERALGTTLSSKRTLFFYYLPAVCGTLGFFFISNPLGSFWESFCLNLVPTFLTVSVLCFFSFISW